MTSHDAVIDGGRRRLRPILMTALATIFALTPMALGITGHGGFISQPLAIVVIGGLISSTVLTLLVLPTLYNLVEGAKERRAARRSAKRSGCRGPGRGARARASRRHCGLGASGLTRRELRTGRRRARRCGRRRADARRDPDIEVSRCRHPGSGR